MKTKQKSRLAILLAALLGFDRCAYECVFAVLVLLAAQCPPADLPPRAVRALDLLSAGSFWLYLAHPMVLELLPDIQGWGGFVLLWCVTAAVCYGLYALAVQRFERRLAKS